VLLFLSYSGIWFDGPKSYMKNFDRSEWISFICPDKIFKLGAFFQGCRARIDFWFLVYTLTDTYYMMFCGLITVNIIKTRVLPFQLNYAKSDSTAQINIYAVLIDRKRNIENEKSFSFIQIECTHVCFMGTTSGGYDFENGQ